ncbi:glycoside hydrolase family 95 protein [Laetiporus sulphureus 93-53]|uniref:Glycoside hydrolase family 95 protein n=1 Tax=Laetiporus sulphureus 93-53 TaxID=1314785 RepID=A0A165ECQ5_9APHY|nr:glycoside hydrolase family 95 protein [Laetiporus sulphureus 93-53]KZT06742.1 glycoside hydrolase family 95 protein [Laetiporus sulphureus 93-53]
MLSASFKTALIYLCLGSLAAAAPAVFPSSGNGLWYTSPGQSDAWSSEWLPIGNGYLAATVPGETVQETMHVNIESLWSGGPMENSSYNGGNKLPWQQAAMAADMEAYRAAIFESENGTINNIEELMTLAGAYGSYAAAPSLLTTLDVAGDVTGYFRWLDLDLAVARTQWSQGNASYFREQFCSNPAEACIQYLNTSADSLPELTYAFSIALDAGLPVPNVTCYDQSTLMVRGLVNDPGMTYEVLARVYASPSATVSCTASGANATISVENASEAWIFWVGGTNYDMYAGNAANGFSFAGPDPHDALLALLSGTNASDSTYADLLAAHVADYTSVMSSFSLSLGQTPDFATPTDQLKDAYQYNVGNPYLEWVLFNFGRYMLASSARGTLPPNLQGKWVETWSNAWGADSNINIQMNHWFAEMTNMDVVIPLFDYIEQTWVPRGAETAQILYNISRGWVTHDEIFGHTGMKLESNSAQWADYPESAVWMMIHVWDHFDYTNDVEWFKSQGWPLLKGVAQFHLDKLIPDLHFNDATLVTNPCNSPEQVPITFGCPHAQQVIWQLFNAVEKGYVASGDDDVEFLEEVRAKRAQMDKGIHIGWWGQLQEWKVDMDSPTDTHRHLSHLIGLYPGYAITSYNESIQNGSTTGYSKSDVLAAAQTSLFHRGNGTGPDADAGWEKVWRAACWAQLANASGFYFELSYAVERNIANNLFSIYTPADGVLDGIFQIDANLGYPAALLNGLLQAPDVASYSIPLVVTILPALPGVWPSGSIKGARIRGGMTLDIEWADSRLTSVAVKVDQNIVSRPVELVYDGSVICSFTTFGGLTQTLNL